MPSFSGQGLGCFRGGRLVFANLSFALQPGNALVLRGPNGSGKSTLLRLMAGLIQPLEGRIQWSDSDAGITDDPDLHYGRTHYVGHADAVKPVLTVTENVAFWARLRTPQSDVAGAIDKLGIAPLADVPGQFLSTGQKRRVNLARILAVPANLWLLDEPATALDVDAIAALCDAIAEHRAAGGMVVASTHQNLALTDHAVLHLSDYITEDPALV
ncbi:MAG: heme ABC exporter ATP-binding protein CcmA [Rhodospirillales bacterium]|nr:heme ABC exporter ATP-binding protein CcmA [Rhodospirillales bacterium]